ncbi:MAG: flagellar export protein FliJ [Gammaproteobacteria bacterium]|nr:flagellar export protein FliJ [Gammaproteobacteria bacterium]
MNRSTRFKPVQRHADYLLRDAGMALSHAHEELRRQEESLRQLITYRDEYGRDFRLHGESARDGAWLRNYQIFLAQLNRGVEQQKTVVNECRRRAAEARSKWETASQKARALDNAVERIRRDEQRGEQRREQRLLDDRVPGDDSLD